MNKPLNKSLSIDKSNWTKVKLGEVVAEPRDTVKDFASEQIEHVVGLEHIDSEDIHLRRSASMDSSTTFTKKFSAGDVLFGRRRAYLKKAAQAKFSGICSGDITVMRAKEGLLPELLPFVVNNDKFFDYAVKHSAGGLSPRVKFKDLADYEFLLPPKHQQAQLAELLWAMDEMVEKRYQFNKTIKSASDIIVSRLLIEFSASNKIKKLGELVKITTGKLDSNAAVDGGKYPFFTCDPKTLQIDKFSFDCEALLLAGNNAAGVFPLKHYDGKFDAYQRTYVITINDTSIVCYSYLLESLKSQLDLLRKLSVGSSTKFLTKNLLVNLKIPLPTIEEQTKIVKKVKELHSAIESSVLNLETSRKLLKSLINQIF